MLAQQAAISALSIKRRSRQISSRPCINEKNGADQRRPNPGKVSLGHSVALANQAEEQMIFR
jgi:hypothetical protein